MTLAHDRRGSGAPLVLVHGIGMSGRAWNPVVDLLASEREVISVDMPGFGRSAEKADGRRTIPELAENLRALITELGLERPHVAGNSMGGGIAFELARLGAAGSVTTFSPIGFGGRLSKAWERTLLRAAYAGAKQAPEGGPSGMRLLAARPSAFLVSYGRPFRVPGDEIRAGTADLAGARGFLDTLPGVNDYRLDQPEALRGIPVTIAWGRRDVLLNWWVHSRRARRVLPWARHVDLAGCGHVPFHDDPERCAQVLIEGSRG